MRGVGNGEEWMDTKDSADLEGTGFSERKGGGAGVCSMVSRVSILRGGVKGRARHLKASPCRWDLMAHFESAQVTPVGSRASMT